MDALTTMQNSKNALWFNIRPNLLESGKMLIKSTVGITLIIGTTAERRSKRLLLILVIYRNTELGLISTMTNI